jgi:hypothetical protein
MSFSPPSIPPDALPASYIVPSTTEVSNGVSARLNVGQDLRDPIALRRAKYIARYVYWAIRHRSTRHVAWVLAFEGYTWN